MLLKQLTSGSGLLAIKWALCISTLPDTGPKRAKYNGKPFVVNRADSFIDLWLLNQNNLSFYTTIAVVKLLNIKYPISSFNGKFKEGGRKVLG